MWYISLLLNLVEETLLHAENEAGARRKKPPKQTASSKEANTTSAKPKEKEQKEDANKASIDEKKAPYSDKQPLPKEEKEDLQCYFELKGHCVKAEHNASLYTDATESTTAQPANAATTTTTSEQKVCDLRTSPNYLLNHCQQLSQDMRVIRMEMEKAAKTGAYARDDHAQMTKTSTKIPKTDASQGYDDVKLPQDC